MKSTMYVNLIVSKGETKRDFTQHPGEIEGNLYPIIGKKRISANLDLNVISNKKDL